MPYNSVDKIIEKAEKIHAKKWKNDLTGYSARFGLGKKIRVSCFYTFKPHYNEHYLLEIFSFGTLTHVTTDERVSSIYSNIIIGK